MTDNGKLILKILIWTVLLHAILIAMTVLEVFIYSSFFNRGQGNLVYEKHAETSGPYIAILAGFVLVYFVALRLAKKNQASKALICMGLPAGYIILDIILLLLSGTNLVDNVLVFSISYATKLLAGYLVLKKSA